MTPAEESYAAAWLAECWAPVREHSSGEGLRKWAADAALDGFASCVICGVVFRQPVGLERPWKWCPECVAEVA